jgi:hypothetical protein
VRSPRTSGGSHGSSGAGQNPTPHRALSSAPPTLNTWNPLVGGSLVFGRSIAGGGLSAWFPGLIDGVEIFNQASTGAEIRTISYQ